MIKEISKFLRPKQLLLTSGFCSQGVGDPVNQDILIHKSDQKE